MRRLALLGAAAFASAALVLPEPVLAHGLVGRQDLPIPRWLFAWAATVVLVASFVGLSVLWREPKLERDAAGRPSFHVPGIVRFLLGTVSVAFFALVVWAGLTGTTTPTGNLTPTAVYVLFWVGLPVLSVLFGDVFRALSPWGCVARATSWVATRAGFSGPEPLAYPERLGRWPAAFGILAFAWLELVSAQRDDPQVLAVLALVYAAVQLVGMSLYGIRPWERHADAFAVYFGLFGALSPLRWAEGRLWIRRPLAGITQLDPVPGTVALLVVMIGSTSFDGFSQGSTWTSLAPDLQSVFLDIGFTQETALELAFTVGLLGVVGVIGLLYRLGVVGMQGVGGGHTASELSRRFVHSLVPIAFAYVLAHYFSLLVYQSQALGFLLSDPRGTGADWLGLADTSIDYGVISATGIWYVQCGALVLGHVAGLALAHDRALVVYDDPRRATRSQYWMLAVMVAFTSIGLWLLSAQAA